jgi:hypothetical protein
MKRFFAYLCFVLGCISSARAEDVKQTILLLPDEEAECRYISSLITKANGTTNGLVYLREKAQQEERSGNILAASKMLIIANEKGMKDVIGDWLVINGALNTIEIKRGKLPACAKDFGSQAEHGREKTMKILEENTQLLENYTARMKR